MDLQRVDRYARLHRGLLPFEESGLTRREWSSALERGDIDLWHRDVARLYGVPITAEMRIQAAVLGAGPDAMASHRSSARLWGADRSDDDPVDIMLPQRERRSRMTDVVVHRPRDLTQLRPVWRKGVPTTDPLRTLVDLGAVDPHGVDGALARFVMDGLVTPHAVRACLVRHSQHGRHGVVALREALERWSIDEKPVDSDLEALMNEILATFDLPPAEFHAVVGGYEVDFHVVGSCVVIECDGWSSHGLDRGQFEYDRFRDSDLVAKGIITVRVTWKMMTTNPRAAARRIEAALSKWSPGVVIAHRSARGPEHLGARFSATLDR